MSSKSTTTRFEWMISIDLQSDVVKLKHSVDVDNKTEVHTAWVG